MTVRVIDADLDTDPSTKQTVSIVVTDGNGETLTILLTENSNNSGIFDGQFSVAGDGNFNASTNQLGANKGDTITALYNDVKNAAGIPVSVSATAVVDRALVLWSTTTLNEVAANDGSFTETITITLVGGDTFINKSPFVWNSEYSTSGIANINGAGIVITRISPTELKLSINGKVSSHGDSADTSVNVQLNLAAFVSGTVAKDYYKNIKFDFID